MEQEHINTEKTIRISTINVHAWQSAWIENEEPKGNEESLAQYILDWVNSSGKSIDVMALQEVTDSEKLSKYASILGFPYFLHTTEGVAAVGLLSKFPIVFNQSVRLDPNDDDCRMLLFSVVEIPLLDANGNTLNFELNVNVTHLDYTKEPYRKKEIDAIITFLKSKYSQQQKNQTSHSNSIPYYKHSNHLLLGDFNSLSKNDYTDNGWKRIATQRKISSWPYKPVGSLMDYLVDESNNGNNAIYIDSISNYKNNSLSKSCLITPTNSAIFTICPNLNITKDQRYSSWTSYYGTRIDYILLSNSQFWNRDGANTDNNSQAQVALSFVTDSYQILPTIPITDHNMVLSDVKITVSNK